MRRLLPLLVALVCAVTLVLGGPSRERVPEHRAGRDAASGHIEGPTGLVERERIGVDARWARGPVGLMAEASTGKDFDDDVRSWLAEFNWTSGTESLLTYLQLRRHEVARAVDGRSADIVGFGVRWLLSNQITLAAQLNHEIRRFDPGLDANELRLHFRFRL